MAGKGHKVDPAQLNEAAKVLQDLPKQACEGPIGAVEQRGPAHGDCFNGYSASIQRLAKCARSYLAASDEFGRKLAASKDFYQSNEDSNAAEMRKH